ncbi:cadherin-like beta sandwich domain-containing protein, partial [Bacteroidales bacterium OttesenSCG-928-B11]|nr:cadherin-like beta sandwich domain-containing protein [Bacteroidales bacterium OttesenSCG-928-B11]
MGLTTTPTAFEVNGKLDLESFALPTNHQGITPTDSKPTLKGHQIFKVCFCMLLLLFTTTAMLQAQTGNWTDAGYDITWYTDNTEATEFSISTPQQLAGLAVLVNGMHGNSAVNFSGKTITLTADIDLVDKFWTPIGDTATRSFQGTFSGAEKTIRNMKVDITANTVSAGLFGYIGTDGVVKKLHVQGDLNISIASSYVYAGGIVGLSYGIIQNCSFTGNTSASTTSKSWAYAGGIAGYNNRNGIIQNCSFYRGSIASESPSSSCAGGIAGRNSGSGIIRNCTVNGGNVTSKSNGSSAYAGGIVGYNNIGYIYNNYARGSVTASVGTQCVGGIAGYAGGDPCSIQNNYFEGTLTVASGTNKGGVVGYNNSDGASIQNNYWQATGTTVAIGGSSNTTGANIKQNAAFTNKGTFTENVYLGTATEGTGYASMLEALNAWVAANQTTPEPTYYNWEVRTGKNNDLPVHAPFYWIDYPDFSWYTAGKTSYSIATANQLAAVAAIVNNYNLPEDIATETFSGDTLILTNNINLSGKLWTPIGTNDTRSFRGTFSGGNHTIRNMEVNITSTSTVYAGLFGYIADGKVENVNVQGNINATTTSNNVYAGGIAGYNTFGTIWNCSFIGQVYVSSGWAVYCGGIVGGCSSGKIYNNYVRSDIHALNGESHVIGGIAGFCDFDIVIQNNYFQGTLSTTSNYTNKGGIVGQIESFSANIQNNYWKADGISKAIGGSHGEDFENGNIRNNSAFTNTGDIYPAVYLDTATSGVGYTNLLSVLNAWREAQFYPGNYMFMSWKTEADTNDGYPIHTPSIEPPIITTHPNDTRYVVGETRSFSVVANALSGGGTLSYQWLLSTDNGETWSKMVGATNATCTTETLNYNDNGNLVVCAVIHTLDGTSTAKSSNTAKMTIENWTDAGNYITSWYNSSLSSYTISTAQQLAGLAVLVNRSSSPENFLNKTITLADSIDLYGRLWTPIGSNAATSNHFRGTFSGAGKTISNMEVEVISSTGNVYAGLFGYISTNGKVEDVNVQGNVNSSTTYSTSTEVYSYSGGIIGYNAYGEIQNCAYTGDVNSYSYSYSKAKAYSYSGGIAGYNLSSTIRNCASTGNVSSYSSYISYSGGIAGYNLSSTIRNCTYTGIASSFFSSSAASPSSYSGGIAGYNSSGKIYNNYARGTVQTKEGDQYVGGIAGYTTNATSTIQNNYFEGILSVAWGNTYKGGIVGRNYTNSAAIQNNYWKDSNNTAVAIGAGSTGTNIKNNAAFTGTGTENNSFASDVYLGTATTGEKYTDMLTALKAWVTTNQTDPATYNTWDAYAGINDDLPVFTIPFFEGAGTADDPFRIYTAEDLDTMHYYVGSVHADKHFRLMNNIDVTEYLLEDSAGYNNGAGWRPIGDHRKPFFAAFHGGGHEISGLWINRETEDSVGLFGVLAHAAIDSLSVVTGTAGVNGKNYVGVLAGYMADGTITSCYATGTVNATDYSAGGLVGGQGGGDIKACYATSAASGKDKIGGLVGEQINGSITSSYAAGKVSGTGYKVGGLIGEQKNSPAVLSCYFNKETTEQINGVGDKPSATGVTPLTTIEMRTRDSFNSVADFSYYFTMTDGKTYPYFSYQSAPVFVKELKKESVKIEILADGSDSLRIYKQTAGALVYLNTIKNIEGNEIEIALSDYDLANGDELLFIHRQRGDGVWGISYPVQAKIADFFPQSGTETEPYLIYNAADLDSVRLYIGSTHAGKHFRVMNNIDVTEYLSEGSPGYNGTQGWIPIGTAANAFYGQFHGGGHEISGLWIDLTMESGKAMDNVGLFGCIGGNSVVDSLGVSAVASGVKGQYNVGILAGYMAGGTIASCYAAGEVRGTSDHVGGLVGYQADGAITTCYAMGSLIYGIEYAGGLVGLQTGGSITSCYATGKVGSDKYFGGLIGGQKNSPAVSSSYFNKETSEITNGVGNNSSATGITPLTTAEMRQQDSFAETFNNYFTMLNGKSYPYFAYQAAPVFVKELKPTFAKLAIPTDGSDSLRLYEQADKNLYYLSPTIFNLTVSDSNLNITDYNLDYGQTLVFVNYQNKTGIKAPSYPVHAEVSYFNQAGTEYDPYLIYTPQDLDSVRLYIGEKHTGKHFRVMNDIDLDEYLSDEYNNGDGWKPIGVSDGETSSFGGTIHGDGHVITNMKIGIATVTSFVGLFAYIGDAGKIEDLHIEGDITVKLTSLDSENDPMGVYTGGVAGINDGQIQNCSYTGLIKVSVPYFDGHYINGIYTGGIAGRNNKAFGWTDLSGTLQNSTHTGDITVSSGYTAYTGGIAGSSDNQILNCADTGNISVTVTASEQNAFAGGIAGYHGEYNQNSAIQNSSHIGSITVVSANEAYCGGIVGEGNGGSICNNYVRGELEITTGTTQRIGGIGGGCSWGSVTIQNNYFEGTLSATATGENLSIGGILGNGEAAIQNCYWKENSTPPVSVAIGRDDWGMAQIANCVAFTGTGTLASAVYLGATAEGTSYTDMLTVLNAWVTKNQTESATYRIWDVYTGINNDLPIFMIPFFDGTGTESDPFLIYTPEDLDKVRKYLGEHHVGKHFRVMNNIDVTEYLSEDSAGYNDGAGWLPIGNNRKPFFATFHGGGYEISGLWINRETEDSVGLFGVLAHAAIDSLSVVTGATGVNGKNYVGGLVGSQIGGTITSCYTAGKIGGASSAGGLVGLQGDGAIKACYATGAVTGSSNVGGLVGCQKSGTITASYATGTVKGESNPGGLVGIQEGGAITASYFNTETTGQTNGIGNSTAGTGSTTGLTSAQMMGIDSYSGMTDFATYYTMEAGKTYPYFRYQAAPVFVNKVNPLLAAIEILTNNSDSLRLYKITSGAPVYIAPSVYNLAEEDTNLTITGYNLTAGDTLAFVNYKNSVGAWAPSYPVYAKVLSMDTTLSDLTVSGDGTLTPAFNKNTFVYYDTVSYATASLTIAATATHPNAVVADTGTKQLSVGPNSFVLTVTAEDNSYTGKYTVNVYRKSNDTTLSALTVNSENVKPDLSPGVFVYYDTVAYATTTATIAATATEA